MSRPLPPASAWIGALQILIGAVAAPVQAASDAPTLSLPIVCAPGKSCFIQNYSDVDAGPGTQDYTCGPAAYEGHKGTDFRVLSIAATNGKVPVVASAAGVVKGARDGVADAFVTEANRAEVAGRECGNGVVIDLGQGWETQYCHMLRDSVAVRPGDRVVRGQRLGYVGYSGQVQFAHVHLSVRKDGKPIDPFTGRAQSDGCIAGPNRGNGLWDDVAIEAFPYTGGDILGLGFVADPAATEMLEIDHEPPVPTAESPAFIFYMRGANLRLGDRIELKAQGPGGFAINYTSPPLDHSKATYQAYSGLKRTKPRWPSGTYQGSAAIIRDGASLESKSIEFELGP